MSSLIELTVHLELKYCERCGALCLRPKGDPSIYCRLCTAAIRDLLLPVDLGRRA